MSISEQQLILPSLLLMEHSETGEMTTTELIKKLRQLLKPTGQDLEILNGRKDDKFSQKVRNLKSHNAFERMEVAKYNNNTVAMTEIGKEYLYKNMDTLRYLLLNDFAWDDLQNGLQIIQTITKALSNVIPVCSNCHRMIHKNWKNPLQIDFLIKQVYRPHGKLS